MASSLATACAILALTLAGCAIERAQEASDAQNAMVGMSKEQVLTCMGAPANSAEVGDTEVWSYDSGVGQITVSHTDRRMVPVVGGFAAGQPVIGGFVGGQPVVGGYVSVENHHETTIPRYCKVDIVMRSDRVSQVNYSGPSGGLLTRGEQCAFAIHNCARQLATIASHGPERASFGVTLDPSNVTLDTGNQTYQGVIVVAVRPQQIGDRAGIKDGDIILTFGGKAVREPHDLQAAIDATKRGETKEIQLFRDGEIIKATATF